MEDSDGTFGGNGSVEWSIDTGNNPKWQCSTAKAPQVSTTSAIPSGPVNDAIRRSDGNNRNSH